MTYGKEDVDYRTDGDASSGYVFNGAESVIWRRIRYNMNSQLSTLYQSLDSSGCWSSTSLINQFDAWQSQFPEELWRLDIERKYYRTYQGGGLNAGATPQPTQRYLKEMMNGRKKYQRRQFERDQEVYMGTKYLSSTIMADQIMFRCNTPSEAVVAPSYDLTITPYSDMYLSVKFGNISPVQIRAKANTQYTVTCPLTDNMDDTAFLIYAASHIKALNDLSACYIHDNDFSKATKLQTLKIGNTTTGYNNAFLTTLNMGNNALLTSLDIRNCGSLAGSLNLSSCGNLEKLYAQGTILSSVIFANYGKVDSVYLPATIKSLTMKNLAYLTTLSATYNVLEELVKENGVVNELTIVQSAYDTLNSVRLVGINWTLSETTILNALAALSDCYLGGTVTLTGQVRQRELDRYALKWPDLTVNYTASNIIPQYLVTYKNANGTTLGTTYVDQGTYPPNPVTAGIISANPTMADTAQYIYTFSGWNSLDYPITADTVVTAVYTQADHTYTVTWYGTNGDISYLDRQTNIAYGASATYSGASLPTKTTDESALSFHLFSGWDKSTARVTSDMTVYAVWTTAALPGPTVGLETMNATQIYALKKTHKFSTANSGYNFNYADYVDIRMGNDFTFSNVESEVLLENQYFDGSTHIDKEIYLFSEDAPSFTLAIDFRFTSTTSGQTLVSAYQYHGTASSTGGFRLKMASTPCIEWGDKTFAFGNSTNRDIVVLRHIAGSKTLYVYASDTTGTAYSNNIYSSTQERTVNVEHDIKLIFGGRWSSADGGTYGDYARGTIYWAKIWYDDLGDDVCQQLASWPHETWRMDYFGTGRYRLEGDTFNTCEASFVSNALLERMMVMNSSSTNAGGFAAMSLASWMKTRLVKALPIEWQSIVETVKIASNGGQANPSAMPVIETKMYLPSYKELSSSGINEDFSEYKTGVWFTSDTKTTIKFKSVVRNNGATFNSTTGIGTVYTGSTNPLTVAANDCEAGDVWYVSNSVICVCMTTTAATMRGVSTYGDTVGNLCWVSSLSAYWWLRSPNSGYSYIFWNVNPYGGFHYANAADSGGLAPCFSI